MVHVRIGVKTGKAQNEQMFSGVPRIADIAQRGWHGREVPHPDIHGAFISSDD
jgi:hypothetical protein